MLGRGIMGVFARSAAGSRAMSTAASSSEKMVSELAKKAISWTKTGNPEFPFEANVAGKPVKMRMNDFPDEHLLSVVDTTTGKDIFHANDMLPTWELPNHLIRTPK